MSRNSSAPRTAGSALPHRENNRKLNGWRMVSDDDGRTWRGVQQLPASLSGDRHRAAYAPDGRLVVCFRDTAANSPTRNHFVAWVGTYEDIVAGREGQYRIKLLHSHAGPDCGYPGLECLPKGCAGYWKRTDRHSNLPEQWRWIERGATVAGTARPSLQAYNRAWFTSSNRRMRTMRGAENWALGLTAGLMTAMSAVEAEPACPVRAITDGPKHHWFGYYDKLQFDPTGRHVLGMEVDFEHRSPRADDEIRVGMVDLRDEDRWIELGTTTAWCWQQGCMLQWRPGSDREVLWNDREGNRFVCRVLDVKTGRQRVLPRAVYALSPDGKNAVTADFRRIQDMRPGYGYPGLPDPYGGELAPEESGVWRVDLDSGAAELIVRLSDIVKIPPADGVKADPMAGAKHYFNHLLVAPDGKRFIFLHRWRQPGKGFCTRMCTAAMDGSDVRVVDPYGNTSHFIWRDPSHILAWSWHPSKQWGFYVYEDSSAHVTAVGRGTMVRNGHCTYLPVPGAEWILNDTYPQGKERKQHLYLYHVPTGARTDLGAFRLPTAYKGEWRCDLHPRSSPDGRTVCIDTPLPGKGRQMLLVDVTKALAGCRSSRTSQSAGHALHPAVPDKPLVMAVYYVWYRTGEDPRWPWALWTRPEAETNTNALAAQRPGMPPFSSAAFPLIGPYDSSDPEVAAWHVKLAKAAGIDAFLVSWWDDHRGRDQAWENGILAAAEREDFKIALLDERAQFHHDFEWYKGRLTKALGRFKDSPAYLHIDGRPVVYLYQVAANATLTPAKFTDLKRHVEAVHGPVYWIVDKIAHDHAAARAGNDAQIKRIPEEWLATPGIDCFTFYSTFSHFRAHRYDELAGKYRYLTRLAHDAGKKMLLPVHPGHDNSCFRDDPYVMPRGNGQTLKDYLRAAEDAGTDMIMVTSWNEWPETTIVEPAETWPDPYLYLKILADWNGRAFTPPPLPQRKEQ